MNANEIEEVRALAIRLLGLTGSQAEAVTSIVGGGYVREGGLPDIPGENDLWRAAYLDLVRRVVTQDYMPQTTNVDASWRILVDLFVAYYSGREVSVTSACLITGSPATTALRHIGILVQQRLVLRCDDPNDRRRANLVLSKEGRDRVELILAAQLRAERKADAEFRRIWNNKIRSM